ncbi:hypothetical protein RCL1_000046 [Eukaryota sp. TZLM3-RCL]
MAVQHRTIKPLEELCFEVRDDPCMIRLEDGQAELFGTELFPNRSYVLRNRAGALFSWQGATISLKNLSSDPYTSSDSLMDQYLAFHAELEQKRDAAKIANEPGPRVLIAGPMDSGKSTLTQILTSFAVRCGRTPAVIDLDVGQSHLSVPGTVSACVFDSPIDVESGFEGKDPLVYWLGHSSPSYNLSYYKQLVDLLSTTVDMRMEHDTSILESGVFVNTCGWVDDAGLLILKDIIEMLRIDIVVVIGSDSLRVKIERNSPNVDIRRFPISSNVVQRSQESRTVYRQRKFQQYFYGLNRELAPDVFTLSFSQFKVYSVESSKMPSRLRPIGAQQVLDEIAIKLLSNDDLPALRSTVLAVSYGTDETDVAESPVAGFVVVSNVRYSASEIDFTSPVPASQLPSLVFVSGKMQWVD